MTGTHSTLARRYAELVSAGELTPDAGQDVAVQALQGVLDRLAALEQNGSVGLFNRALAWIRKSGAHRGVYLWGDVGRGKTMLMDMFFEAAPVANKRRQHFHAFMADIHERLHKARAATLANGGDPVGHVATEIADGAQLLCFDEFAVHDVADASILGRLFTHLIEAGVIVVATSNVEPARLYEGGRNRDLFLPFISLLSSRLDVVRVDAPTDYRMEKGRVGDVYFAPLGDKATESMDRLFLALAGVGHGAPATLNVKRRTIFIPQSIGRVARMGFGDICGQILAASDFLALASHYDSLLIDDVPVLTPDRRNDARRLIMLIDVLYESRALLAISAAAEPPALYNAAMGAEAQDFSRAASRLMEMRSQAWVENTVAGAGLRASTYTP
jgi:cell division protein ZapE